MLVVAAFGVLFEAVGFVRGEIDAYAWAPLLGSGLFTGFCGASAWRFGRDRSGQMRRTEAVMTVSSIWLFASIFAAIPFIVGARIGPIDALFETVSGLTTTGATIITDIEGTLSRPMLLWRSLIQWLGGMGIVVLMVAILPNLGVGGKHMFRSEVPGHSAEGLVPRITETSVALYRIYAAITLVLAALLTMIFTFVVPSGVRMSLGEATFEAVCHAFTTMATGGFSTRNASIAAFQSPVVDFTIATFMFIAGVNYAIYYGVLVHRSLRVFFRSLEFRVYAGMCALMVMLISLNILPNHGWNYAESFRHAYFMVATNVTSTGFGLDDYMAYPSFSLGLIIVLMFVGACSGSTAGGIKVSRIVLLVETTWAQLRRSVRPNVVQVVRLDGKAVAESTLNEVAMFFFAYMMVLLVSVLFVAATDGVGLPTAFGATLTSLSNMGPAPYYGPGGDHFADYSAVAKVWFSVVMVLGRLELVTLLALLMPDLWRR